MSVAVIQSGTAENVKRALSAIGIESTVTLDPTIIESASHIILPGQGKWDTVVSLLDSGLRKSIMKAVLLNNAKYLGICLGAQLLFALSEEGKGTGLGLLPGKVKELPIATRPHVGWAMVDHPYGNPWMYYSHSYYCDPADSRDILGYSLYDGFRFPAYFRRGSVCGCQFHPEKSQDAGLRFLKKWLQ